MSLPTVPPSQNVANVCGGNDLSANSNRPPYRPTRPTETETKKTDAEISQLRNLESKKISPASRCPACIAVGRPSAYGRHYWRDAYGTWHCTECEPPAVLAMVREEVLIDPDGPDGGKNTDGKPHGPKIIQAELSQFPRSVAGEWRERPDHAGRWGLERVGLPEWARWWARVAFEDLPELMEVYRG